MAVRRARARNNHLEEAMALLIRNQAAFVEQIARNDQERLALQRRSDEHWLLSEERWRKDEERWRKNEERWRKNEERWRKNEEWQRKAEERFDRIEATLLELPQKILRTILDQLPQIKKEIGFKVQK